MISYKTIIRKYPSNFADDTVQVKLYCHTGQDGNVGNAAHGVPQKTKPVHRGPALLRIAEGNAPYRRNYRQNSNDSFLCIQLFFADRNKECRICDASKQSSPCCCQKRPQLSAENAHSCDLSLNIIKQKALWRLIISNHRALILSVLVKYFACGKM